MDMSCIQDHYGRSIIELLIPMHNILQEDAEGRKIPKITVRANSSIPFQYSIPLFHPTDSRQPY